MGAQISFGEPSFSTPNQLVTWSEAFVPEPGFLLAFLPPPLRRTDLSKKPSLERTNMGA